MIPKRPVYRVRGPLAECGICGCRSNLWSKNNPDLDGRLVCPGQIKYPDKHQTLHSMEREISRVAEVGLWQLAEGLVIDVLKLKIEFKAVKVDVDDDSCPTFIPGLDEKAEERR